MREIVRGVVTTACRAIFGIVSLGTDNWTVSSSLKVLTCFVPRQS